MHALQHTCAVWQILFKVSLIQITIWKHYHVCACVHVFVCVSVCALSVSACVFASPSYKTPFGNAVMCVRVYMCVCVCVCERERVRVCLRLPGTNHYSETL